MLCEQKQNIKKITLDKIKKICYTKLVILKIKEFKKMNLTRANKQFKNVYGSYKRSDYYTLNDLYNNASYYKQKAYNYCRDLYHKLNGHDFKIIGGNCMTFSVGFTFFENGVEYFAYITKDYDRKFLVDELI
jgi:hypothetical protein